jgi:DNA-binding response OmpR family regulator
MKAVILWIESQQAEGSSFINTLRKKGYQIEVAPNGNEAVQRLPKLNPDLVVVNAASLRTSGVRICSALKKQSGKLPIVFITQAGQPLPGGEYVDAVLVLPFTARKLLNWITPLLPWGDNQAYTAGLIRLDVENRRVECNGKITRLTPSLTALLKIMIEHQGEVLPREDLFRQVWETNYTVDTRTLDVHISWLRQAIEENPHKPVHLKTIRGVGYRFDG